MSACKFWQTYKHMYTYVHISINILFSHFDIFCAYSVLCAHVYMFVCLYMCTSRLHTSMCTHAFVISITANIHIFTFSIDSQSLFFYLVFEHVLYFVYSFEGLMED